MIYIHKLFVTILIIAVILSSLLIMNNQNKISLLNDKLSELQSVIQHQEEELENAKNELSSVKDQYREEFSKNYTLTQELNKIKPFYEYCDQHFVFVVGKTTLYHKPVCVYLQDGNSSFTAYTITTAKQKGYSPCWLCCQ